MHRFVYLCVCIHLLAVESLQCNNMYGVRKYIYPKSSCWRIDNVHCVGQCFQLCLANLGIHYMFSYDGDLLVCLCCVDLSGNDLIGPSWKTYETTYCSDGGGIDEHQICLKYLPLEVTYLEAENRCHLEGGALFKLDSQLKYNLFQEFLGPIAQHQDIQVWIQAERTGVVWYFDDGSVIPSGICPLITSNSLHERRLRFRVKDKICEDNNGINLYNYTCEYKRYKYR